MPVDVVKRRIVDLVPARRPPHEAAPAYKAATKSKRKKKSNHPHGNLGKFLHPAKKASGAER